MQTQMITRKPCWSRGNCSSKFSSIRRMQAANVGKSRHLGFDRTGNSAIRFADPEKPY